jgi:nucleoside 2-deoxyribosyltransferase
MERRKLRTVYLAGPIEQVSLEEGASWREKAAKIFNDNKVLVCDPHRMWVLSPEMHSKCSDDQLGAIVEVDLFIVGRVDALLVKADNSTYTCGTWVEVEKAIRSSKPIVFYTPDSTLPGFIKGMIFNADDDYIFVCHDLADACERLVSILGVD